MDPEHQQCPVCSTEVDFQFRYPRYLCEACRHRTTDAGGRPVDFFNYDLGGYGVLGQYRDREEPYDENFCFVDGIRCIAEEARFGGIEGKAEFPELRFPRSGEHPRIEIMGDIGQPLTSRIIGKD